MKPRKRRTVIRVLDRKFSQIIRKKAGHICEHCRSARATDCSHFIRRKYIATRWLVDNVSAACRRCHQHLEIRSGVRLEEWGRLRGDAAVAEMLDLKRREDSGELDLGMGFLEQVGVQLESADG